MFEIELLDKIAILKLNRGITNPLNLDFIENILKKLNTLKTDENLNALILTTNNNKFFSIGFDLPELQKKKIVEVEKFYRTFNQLCIELHSFPKPTIAVLTGHAIAGGCILSLCCDYRFISDGRKLMGLNEIKLGIPIPCPAYFILEQIVGTRNTKLIIESGEFYEPEELLKLGLVDQVLPDEHILDNAITFIQTISSYPKNTIRLNLKNSKEKTLSLISSKLDDDVHNFLTCWQTGEVQSLLSEAVKKY